MSSARAHAEDLDAPDPGVEEVDVPEWNEYDGKYFSMRAGLGLLLDYAEYEQDADSEVQMPIFATGGIRDLRFLVAGRLVSKQIVYTVGYMYDAREDKWVFRQTGLNIHVPQVNGLLFVGRTKEGFSTNKMMVGYYGWFNERSAANDAFLPILADGARFTGRIGNQVIYNLGAFNDWRSEIQSFNKNDWQFVGRVVWLPFGAQSGQLLHLAAEARYAGADDGMLRYRSKPESFLAQTNAVDTGAFEAERSTMTGLEAYYVRGPLSSGSEYFFNKVSSMAADDPFFHGGEAFVAYLLTGETHPYKPQAGVFDEVLPRRSLVAGGPGAWELAARISYVDLDSGPIEGGKFSRVTTILNWYVSETLRFEASYAYGWLDRMDMSGGTHFFQTRMQLAIPTK